MNRAEVKENTTGSNGGTNRHGGSDTPVFILLDWMRNLLIATFKSFKVDIVLPKEANDMMIVRKGQQLELAKTVISAFRGRYYNIEPWKDDLVKLNFNAALMVAMAKHLRPFLREVAYVELVMPDPKAAYDDFRAWTGMYTTGRPHTAYTWYVQFVMDHYATAYALEQDSETTTFQEVAHPTLTQIGDGMESAPPTGGDNSRSPDSANELEVDVSLAPCAEPSVREDGLSNSFGAGDRLPVYQDD